MFNSRTRSGLWTTGLSVLAITVAPTMSGCIDNTNPQMPSDAYGSASNGLPEGATEIDYSQLQDDLKNGRIKLLNPKQQAANDDADQARRARIRSDFDALVALHPDLSARLKGNFVGDRTLKLDPNCAANDPNCETVRLLEDDERMAGIVGGANRFPKPENKIEMYSDLLGAVVAFNQANPASQISHLGNYKIENLPTVAEIGNMSDATREQWISVFTDPSVVASIGITVHDTNPNANDSDYHLTHFDADLGANATIDSKTDSNSYAGPISRMSACQVLAHDGIVKNFNFAERKYLTGGKNQGGRGTCWAFSLTSMLETKYASLVHDFAGVPTYINLSEQDLIFQTKRTWYPTSASYGDGAGDDVLARMISENYTQPYENTWDYNQSNARVADDATLTYHNSCPGHREYCSDTNHQGNFFCARSPDSLWAYCGFKSQSPAGSPGVRPTRWVSLWDWNSLDRSMALMQLYATFGIPVQLGFDVYSEFTAANAWDAVSGNGWVKPSLPGSSSIGGHAVHVVGYISNDQIAATPALANQLHDSTTGGGYFIIKNSWGVCTADAGFYYVPAAWIRAHAVWILALTGIA